MGKRRTYSKEFKEESVQYLLSHPERTIIDVFNNILMYDKVIGIEKSSFLLFNSSHAFDCKGCP